MPFKDAPNGTTHFHDDGCGEPAHNTSEQDENGHKIKDGVIVYDPFCKHCTKTSHGSTPAISIDR